MRRTDLPLGPPTTDRRVTHPDTLFFGDNGKVLCGEHLGVTARLTGRDLSGHPIEPVTPAVLAECRAGGWEPRCERCGKEAQGA